MAKKSINDIEKLFKETIDGHLEPPSPGTWEAIEKQLEEKSDDKKRGFFFFRRWVLLMLLLITGTVGYFSYINYSNPQNSLREKNDRVQIETATEVTNISMENKNSDYGEEIETETVTKEVSERNEKNVVVTYSREPKKNASSLPSDRHKKEGETYRKEKAGDEQPINSVSAATKKNRVGITFNDTNSKINSQKKIALQRKPVSKDAKPNTVVDHNEQVQSDPLHDKNDDSLRTVFQPHENSAEKNTKSAADTALNIPVQLADTTEEKITLKKQKATSFKPFYTISIVYAPNDINNKLEQGVQQYKEDKKEEIKQQEKIEKSFAYGVLAEYSFRENWAIQSGLKLSSTVTSIQSKHIFARPDITTLTSMLNYKYNSTSGYAYIPNIVGILLALGDSVKTLPSVSTVNYANVPLTLQYSPSIGRFFFVGTAGVSMNILTRATLDTEIDFFGIRFGRTYTLQGLKKTYISGNLGLGAGYLLSEKFSVYFSPTRTFSFGPVNENTPVKKYERATGYQALLRYRL